MSRRESASRTAQVLVICGAGLAVAPTLRAGVVVLPAAVGLLLVVGGASRGSRRAVHAGALGLYLGLLGSGVRSASPLLLLTGTIGGVIAWDSATNGLELTAQLGDSARTRQPELVRATATGIVALLVAIVAVAGSMTVRGERPTVGLVVLLMALLACLAAVTRQR